MDLNALRQVDQAVASLYPSLLRRGWELVRDGAEDLVQEVVTRLYGRIRAGLWSWDGEVKLHRWLRSLMQGLVRNERERTPVVVNLHW